MQSSIWCLPYIIIHYLCSLTSSSLTDPNACKESTQLETDIFLLTLMEKAKWRHAVLALSSHRDSISAPGPNKIGACTMIAQVCMICVHVSTPLESLNSTREFRSKHVPSTHPPFDPFSTCSPAMKDACT